MFYASRFVPALSILGLLAPACVDEATDPGAHEFRTTAGGGSGCGGCTLNSPRGNDFHVPELDLAGSSNDDGIRLMGLIDLNDYGRDLRVNGDELVAVDANNQPVASAAGLVGYRIWLRNKNDEDRYIYIRGHQSVSPEANPTETISLYALAYQDPVTGRFKNLCPENVDDPGAATITVIGGERYRVETDDPVIDSPDWITIACKQQAIYKMKLLGYSPHIPLGNDVSSVDQRKATLHMIRAAYCDDGESYTEQGTPVNWYNYGDTIGSQQAALVFEAVWGPDGALCLSNQRRPEMNVSCAATLPACEGMAFTGYEWTTQVPPPPPPPDTDTEGP